MDEMLSQDEINALINGMDLSNNENAESDTSVDESQLSADAKDAIGEIANISMGTSATTLYSLVNMKVEITTPMVTMANWKTVVAEYERPCVFVQIRYTSGLDGSNIMILKEQDVKVITDLMMGGDGSNTEGELEEFHLSAISEAMNQMMGAAATSLSTMMGKTIDISPPQTSILDLNDIADGGQIDDFLGGDFVKIAFRMQIGDLVESSIMQLYPLEFANSLYETFITSKGGGKASEAAPEPAPAQTAATAGGMPDMGQGNPQMNMGPSAGMQMNSMPNMQYGMPQMGVPMMGMNGAMGMPMMNMNIQPAQFQSFNTDAGAMAGAENIGLIRDVFLDVTVELGRTKKSIAEILDFAPGTIIDLDRIAGEPVDVLVNGKFVARGEVMVMEESFCIRVTEIIK